MDFIIDLKKPSKKTFFMKVGSSNPDSIHSNIIKNEITICGKEKITTSTSEPLLLNYFGYGETY